MKKIRICLLVLIFCIVNIGAQEIDSQSYSFFDKNRWNENIFDLRIIDIPQAGILYCVDDSNVVYRVSTPITIPLLFILPINVTYYTSFWGINCLLADVTFGFKSVILYMGESEIPFIIFSDSIVVRALPTEICGGIPLSPGGMGIYASLEIVPFALFNHSKESYQIMYTGFGVSAGVKYVISRNFELGLKFENYFSYSSIEIWKKYVGLTFKYRLFEPGYYGIW